MASIPGATVGQRLSFDGAICTVRYVGEVSGTQGVWLGVEWDDPSRGRHNGQHQGVRYFSCASLSPTAASFVRPTRPADARQTFLSALQRKYAVDGGAGTPDQGRDAEQHQDRAVVISGKVAEEVGFDKIRRKMGQLEELKIVILDGARVDGPATGSEDRGQSIGRVCPKIVELDLSRNLFTLFGTVLDACRELGSLKSLRLNGNRFRDIRHEEPSSSGDVSKTLRELELGECLLDWQDICHVASHFPSLSSLLAGTNQLSLLTPLPPFCPFASTLVSLNLEFNHFTSLADLAVLTGLRSLRNLHLKGNRIGSVVPPSSTPKPPPPIFPRTLQYLDVSYNEVSSWSFIDSLQESCPGLTSLRFAHNPIYDSPDLEDDRQYHNVASTAPAAAIANSSTDEAYMLLVGRLPHQVRTVNFSTVTAADRTNAEMYYLSRIARQLSSTPESAAQTILARHRRWAELCAAYGEPVVARRDRNVDPNFLEARLIGVRFYMRERSKGAVGQQQQQKESGGGGGGGGRKDMGETIVARKIRIPKAFDTYTVKSIAGKLFGLPPLQVRLVWETGEWDPVAGFDEMPEDEDSEDEEDEEGEEGEEDMTAEPQQAVADLTQGHSTGAVAVDVSAFAESTGEVGRWVRREVELKDSPRQLGYCVDGMEATIRVELR